MKIHNYILLIACLMMASCEETVILDVPFESQLVVNSFFDSDSPWAIEVTTSNNILDNSTRIEFVTDARVIVYDQDNIQLYELYHQGNGVYGREDFSPSPTRGYYVQVTSGAKVATAYSYVPEKSKLTINTQKIVTEDKQEGIEVDFQIEDQSSLEAYYIWEIIAFDQEGGSSTTEGSQLSDLFISNLSTVDNTIFDTRPDIVDQDVFGNGTFSTVYNTLEDRSFGRGVSSGNNGKIIINREITGATFLGKEDLPDVEKLDEVFEVAYDPVDGEDGGDGENGGGSEEEVIVQYELRVMSISKELFDYYRSVERSQANPNTSINNQYPIYNNVVGGLGIFAGFSESVIRF